jgi:tetratricopeptide (TPR) repeat protein/predicted Ser/Thr protein kinase
MDCPHCTTPNPPGARSCTNCRTPLGGNNETLVGELTPPIVNSGTTLDGTSPSPPARASSDTLDELPAGSMAIPADWSVPASGRVDAGHPMYSGAPLRAGSLLGNRYEIITILGEGGMGAVYKARDRELDRLVAIKVIRPELAGRPEILQRFKQELILARKVTHRNVIRIFDLGEAGGVKFITMEFIEGRDLKHLLTQSGKLPADRAVEIIQQVCLALEAAHTEGVVHRDLKPQNIMMDGQGRALVMDFGIARSLEAGGMTQTGALIGTPEYMSPEQVRGEHVDARSDLFTLGVIFQEILTGQLPYQAETAMASMFKRTMERAVAARELDKTIPPFISEIVGKCLEIDPAARFQSARELFDALESWRHGSAAPFRIRTVRWMRQARQLLWVWIAPAFAVALVLVAIYIYRARSTNAPPVAHSPVTVIISDFNNHTGDEVFAGTLESTLKLALEGASFIGAYDRTRMRDLGMPAVASLDESKAQEIAAKQGLNVVISGSLDRQGNAYQLSLRAVQAITGKTVLSAEESASNKNQVLFAVTKLGTAVRKALGDSTSDSDQRFSMETLTAASLEAVHEYALALDALSNGRNEEAQKDFSQSVDLDANFGLAYAGLAASTHNLGEQQAAEKYIKQAITHIDHMTERERFRTRGYLYYLTGDNQKCVDEYGTLLTKYPTDTGAYNNMADCSARLRNIPRAVEQVRKAVSILPKRATYHVNVALYSAYGSDFKTAADEAKVTQQLNPSYVYGYLAEAFSDMGSEQLPQAAEVYQKISTMNPSIGASGLADLALYQGRFKEAVAILQKGAADDSAAHKPDAAADKLTTLGYTQLLRGDKSAALAAVKSALDLSKEVKTKFIAARIFVATAELAEATEISKELSSELQAEPQAYGKLIEGEIALKKGDGRGAVKLFTDGNTLLDTWMGRFDLGRAYLEIGAFTEADSEFDRCITRRGETLALFLDEVPTYGYFPEVYYYQGRVREGLKSEAFKESYKKYLDIRGNAAEDPLLAEIRRRVGS